MSCFNEADGSMLLLICTTAMTMVLLLLQHTSTLPVS
jgi:hypothetical protein